MWRSYRDRAAGDFVTARSFSHKNNFSGEKSFATRYRSSVHPMIVRDEVVQEIKIRSNSGTARKHDLRKGDLVRDFENFNFLHVEIRRTREKRGRVQSGVVRVTVAKVASVAVTLSVAAIGNINVAKVWTGVETTIDCVVLLFSLQRKSPRRDFVRILQREKETLHTRIGLALP
jgi:hypothetical protein